MPHHKTGTLKAVLRHLGRRLAALPLVAVVLLAGCVVVAAGCVANAGEPRAPVAGADVHLPVVVAPDAEWWRPGVGTTWQWQLDGRIDTSIDAQMYGVDLFDTGASVLDRLRQDGRQVVCYISAGSWENWRPDANDFPDEVLGHAYDGWPGERWLDIRRIDLLGPIMSARLDLCRDKGFVGVEPDNIDGYTNDTGFPLSYADQLAYNQWFAGEAHARGLSVGLKNDDQQVADLLPYFDWAMTEECFDQGWCGEMSPFIAAGKPVFAAEYTDTGITLEEFCPAAAQLQFSAILKRRSLNAWREGCP